MLGFKKRLSVVSLWQPRITGMFSGKNEPGWDALKASFHDPALNAVDPAVFYAHMQAMTIEIVNIAVAKSCPLDVSAASSLYVDKFLKDNGHAEIIPLVTRYSQAFGSSSRDGVKEIVTAFSQSVADSRLSPSTNEGFYNTLYQLLGVVLKMVRDVKLVP